MSVIRSSRSPGFRYRSPAPEIDGRIIDWSFAALLGVVGIYHTARGFDELPGSAEQHDDVDTE